MVTWKIKGIYKADAEKVQAEIENLGECTAEDIVEFAKDKNTELHKCFEWDDKEAAHKWRIQQARLIACNIVYVNENKEPTRVRATIYSPDKKSYVPTRLIIRNEDEYARVLERAYAELRAFKEKYKTYSELEEIFVLID